MKFKHNKKRNTALLFEYLVKEITKTVINEDKATKQKLVEIMKKFFSKGTVLSKELKIYKSIYETENLQESVAEKILKESQTQFSKLDKKKIFKAQTDLIKEINKNISKGVYSNFVPSYKDLATIYQVFNLDLSPKQKVLLEEKVVVLMTQPRSEREKQEPAHGKLVYSKFVESFNQTYGGSLLEEQKDLLHKYIGSIGESMLEFKIHLNEEIDRIKNVLNDFRLTEKCSTQPALKNKLDRVFEIIEGFKTKEIDQALVERVLKLQSVASEIVK